MKIQEIMTRDVRTCTLDSTLTQVARLMQTGGCGIIPVIGAAGRVAGVITDRDIALALLNTSRKPVNIAAREVMSRELFSVLPDADVRKALVTMQEHRVRRLPVVDDDGRLKGILSIDDVILRALAADAPTPVDIVQTLREILSGLRETPELMAEDLAP
jgi:CBS domain-containing protein